MSELASISQLEEIATHKHPGRPAVALSKYRELEEIQQKVRKIREAKFQCERRFELEMKDLNDGLEAVQRGCHHELTKTYRDASGGMDHDVYCMICTKRIS